MKLKTLLSTSLVSAAFLISSCGGGSSSSSGSDITSGGIDNDAFNAVDDSGQPVVAATTNTDAAPETLDKTKLSITGDDDFSFYFNKTGGDATTAAGETGVAPAFAVTTEELRLNFSSGFFRVYDLPEFVTDLSYIYTKTSESTGTIQLQGQGSGDGGTDAGVNSANKMDVFVSPAGGGGFTATINLSFGSNGSVVSSIAVVTTVVGTSDASTSSLTFQTSTGADGAYIKLQNGDNLPQGYTTSSALSITSVNPASIFPAVISTANEIEMNFSPSVILNTDHNGLSKYVINNFLPSNQGFSNVRDQGLARLTPTDNTSATALPDNVLYAWETNDTSTNVGLLTLTITRQDATGISLTTTEIYALDFNTNSSGNFQQLQPNTAIFGEFSLPFIANSEQ